MNSTSIESTTGSTTPYSPDNFLSALGTGFVVLLVSDFADNSFVALSIFALKHGTAYILIPACVITIATQFVSVLIGEILTLFIPQIWLAIGSAGFFIAFGSIMAYEGISQEKILDSASSSPDSSGLDLEAIDEQNQPFLEGLEEKHKKARRHVWIQMFFILFVGEMGDRSQLATIALTTTTNFWGIFIGGSLGLLVDAIIAVWIGGWLKRYISEYTATLVGGIIFVIMGLFTAMDALFWY